MNGDNRSDQITLLHVLNKELHKNYNQNCIYISAFYDIQHINVKRNKSPSRHLQSLYKHFVPKIQEKRLIKTSTRVKLIKFVTQSY
jgi:hypothetical protein